MNFKSFILFLLLTSSVAAVGIKQELTFDIVIENSSINDTPGIIVKPQLEAFIIKSSQDIGDEEKYLWKINDSQLVEKLVIRKQQDNKNFNNILSIAVKVDSLNRENTVREVIDMDREFVEGFSNLDDAEINGQLSNYFDEAKNPLEFRFHDKDTQIEKLYKKKWDIEVFIENLWDSLTN